MKDLPRGFNEEPVEFDEGLVAEFKRSDPDRKGEILSKIKSLYYSVSEGYIKRNFPYEYKSMAPHQLVDLLIKRNAARIERALEQFDPTYGRSFISFIWDKMNVIVPFLKLKGITIERGTISYDKEVTGKNGLSQKDLIETDFRRQGRANHSHGPSDRLRIEYKIGELSETEILLLSRVLYDREGTALVSRQAMKVLANQKVDIVTSHVLLRSPLDRRKTWLGRQ